jgi:hypothetical protein
LRAPVNLAVAEELGLDQAFGQRGAVDRDESARPAARAMGVAR